MELVFLGTGGGRFTTITQRRRTGGIRILSPANLQIDPGTGAIAYSNMSGLDPSNTEGIFVSHCHPDHYDDAEVFIEAMTRGMTRRRGLVVAPRSVLRGNDVCGPAISKYHQTMPSRVLEVAPGEAGEVGGLRFRAMKTKHSDPDTVGFMFEFDEGPMGYTSDTEYEKGLGKEYDGCRLLIVCVLRPRGSPWKGHMTTDDAISFLKEANPETAVLTDFGFKMLDADPEAQAKLVQEETGIRTVAARDNMRVRMKEKIIFDSLEPPRKTFRQTSVRSYGD